jgi:hypothetical protein
VIQKVDPTMKSLLNRQETDPNRAKSTASAASSGKTPTGMLNKQEKTVGAGVSGANAGDPSKEVHQLQRGLLNEQKVNVGVTQ